MRYRRSITIHLTGERLSILRLATLSMLYPRLHRYRRHRRRQLAFEELLSRKRRIPLLLRRRRPHPLLFPPGALNVPALSVIAFFSRAPAGAI